MLLLSRESGDSPAAELLATEAVELAAATDFLDLQGNTLLGLANVLQLAGKSEAAPPLLEQARQAFERKGNIVAEARAVAAQGDRVG